MRKAFQEARSQALIKRARKALRRTPSDLQVVHVRARSTGEMVLMLSLGFSKEEVLDLGRGAGPQQYLMAISREDLDTKLAMA